ncbi:glycosyltransferase family A protein [Amycolatopsis sp. PS_44_ISF1]|uniref:glycosyltransferase n=1 Tax=Amycolatopsis sp. PS_44_ISF1 TaxID=2974917 RepID=UPI0028DF4C80|nr:glycosyltransferase family A protein [Amycolatopsis sp. PS_44_ISF1]MDT8911802.1 glycosyltransferase family 2 protein [Amycolatopsis sp. PS_44_ISF1]MDT8916377.1 glycosyltransferase family 2 protein [Amycolatopsis sp. PS_44_ISF1]
MAKAVAGSVVLEVDVFAQTAAPDYWNWSVPAHRTVTRAARALDEDGIGALAVRLQETPGDGAVHHELVRKVAHYFASENPDKPSELCVAAMEAEKLSRLIVHVGEAWRPGPADEVPIAAAVPNAPPPRAGEPVDAAVVIPFRGSGGTARLRNLRWVLASLNDQTAGRSRYRIVVVETDEVPRWRQEIQPLCDTYLHAYNDGRFNKAWAVNVGVVHGAAPAEAVCVLDADILVDRDFVARALARFGEPGTQAHWPFQDLLFLDEDSSRRAIRNRCVSGRPEVDQRLLRGVYLRRPPGGCLWLRTSLFRRIGGMDERFAGWGGEDQDFEWRVDRYGALDRHADPIVHLDHPRAQYRADDGTPFFEEIGFCSWPCDSAIGDLGRYELDRRGRV